MTRFHRFLLVGLFCLAVGAWVACNKSSPEDKERLALLSRDYKDGFVFGLEGDFYLHVAIKQDQNPSENEIDAIYRRFFFNEGGARRRTSFVYMNVYDSRNSFQYQIYFSPVTDKLIRGKTEHY